MFLNELAHFTHLGLPLGDNPVKLFGLLLHGGVEDLGLVQHHSHLVCQQKRIFRN
jgi:hypothetical protein